MDEDRSSAPIGVISGWWTRHFDSERAIWLVLSLLLGVFLGLTWFAPPLRYWLLVLLTIGAVVYAYTSSRYLVLVLGVAYLARITLVIVDIQLGLLPSPPVASEHHQNVLQVVDAWQRGTFVDPDLRVSYMFEVVAHLLAPFYALLGGSPVAGRLAIATYGTLVGYPVYRLARILTDVRTSLIATGVVLFWPSVLFRSLILQREVIIVLAMLTIVWLGVKWVDEFRHRELMLFFPAVWLVYALREQNLLLIAVIIGTALLIRSRISIVYGLVGAAGILIGISFISGWFDQLNGVGRSITPHALDLYAHRRAHGDAAYLVSLHYRSWGDVVLAAPIKVFYYLGSPLPWHVSSLAGLLAGLSGWATLVACAMVPRGVHKLLDRWDRLAVTGAYLISGVLAYAIIEMNYGAAFRRRIQFVPIILILAIIGVHSYRHMEARPASEEGEGSKEPVAD